VGVCSLRRSAWVREFDRRPTGSRQGTTPPSGLLGTDGSRSCSTACARESGTDEATHVANRNRALGRAACPKVDNACPIPLALSHLPRLSHPSRPWRSGKGYTSFVAGTVSMNAQTQARRARGNHLVDPSTHSMPVRRCRFSATSPQDPESARARVLNRPSLCWPRFLLESPIHHFVAPVNRHGSPGRPRGRTR
jgi:hypothetical protein